MVRNYRSKNTDGKPDPLTIKAFFATANQGVNYRTGVWRK